MSSSSPEATTVEDKPEDLSASKGLVKRAVDRLGRSKSIGSKLPLHASVGSGSGHKRIFSLSRKGKDKEDGGHGGSRFSPRSLSPRTGPHSPTGFPASDDSPFIRPPSPPMAHSIAGLPTFRGDGSIRAGTQALIQALQAIPWAEDQDNDDEIMNHNVNPGDISSDEEDRADTPLASSLHTIHRPVARSRRADMSKLRNIVARDSDLSEEDPEPDTVLSSETEDADFEVETPRPPERVPHAIVTDSEAPSTSVLRPESRGRGPQAQNSESVRSGSMATVRLQRRARLADKLKEVFELEGIEEVVAEMPCWLLRSVLLQGYMYLTNSYLCFFAHMPAREDQVLKSGSLMKKAQRTKRWIRHWFVLKNDVLSWYQSPSDPYFPHGIVDLRYAFSCEPTRDKEIRIRTNAKTIMLSADSVASRDEWVKVIRRVIFKAQNMGDSVKIAIPYSAILDVDKSSAMDFSETIEVKILDSGENDSIDSYFFAYFNDLSGALEHIRDAVRENRTVPQGSSPQAVLDTSRQPSAPTTPGRTTEHTTSSSDSALSKAQSAFRIPFTWRPFQESTPTTPTRVAGPSERHTDDNEEFTHIAKRKSGVPFIPFTSSPTSETPPSSPPQVESGPSHAASVDSSITITPSTSADHTYPPSTSNSMELPHTPQRDGVGSNWTVPTWLRVPSRRVLNPFGGFGTTSPEHHSATLPVSEVYSGGVTPSGSRAGELAFSVLEAPGATVDAEVAEKFRRDFALDGKEDLLGYFSGYIYRLLPLWGRLYVSKNFFCFRSGGPLSTKTRMMLPIREILSVQRSRAFHPTHYGVVLIVKGYEELFFEFGDEERRTSFIRLLERQMDDMQQRLAGGESPSQRNKDAMILEGFGSHSSLIRTTEQPSSPDAMAESLPAVMFTSTSSTFLTFKPEKSLRFTFLTIGSRGDVQPYIALAKGLQADGHSVKIATHGEFREWVESYGIEFGYVGGDPAELMRICVENGMFTVSFLKEGLQKFRGWLDDLLKTSWEACQGTDVLVESPSAMAGIHIAEALRIPYFRAFTMTWTRTRAYPHAFAVPERKMGGSYNYMSYVMFDQVFWRAISGQINRWRRNVLSLGSTSLDKMEPHKIPFLYNFSPVVVPPPLDWPEWIQVTGYWFLDDAEVGSKKWAPPADLVEFIDSAHNNGRKVVYIGFGSIVVSDPKAMTRTVIEAIVRSGVCAILSKGWSDRLVKTAEASEPEEPLPKQIYPITSLPHDWLFKRIDAACHHGGAGTTGASLRAGIPTIIKPFFGDQFFWADRVEALGIGSGVRRLSVETLTDALLAATTDQKQIARAKAVGEQIRAENGVANAIEVIYRDLEYARSLIKRPSTSAADDAEHATIRDYDMSDSQYSTPERPSTRSGDSENESHNGASSEDWSVVSGGGEHRSSVSSADGSNSEFRLSSRRSSLSAAVLSVIPGSLSPTSRSRSLSTSR